MKRHKDKYIDAKGPEYMSKYHMFQLKLNTHKKITITNACLFMTAVKFLFKLKSLNEVNSCNGWVSQ